MGRIIAAAKELQLLIGGLVLVVHHMARPKKRFACHSSLLAALDTAIEVTKTDIRSEWNIAKSKDDAAGNSYSFKLEVVKIGHDIEGEEITSCVAEYGGSKTPSKRGKSSLGSNQAIALKLIKEQIKTSPHILVDGVPEGKKLSCL